jgi:thiamine biosynthesis lipoprotein
MERVEFHAMGCGMMAALDRDGPNAAARLAQVPAWFETWESRLSRFRQDSELSQLNRDPGRTHSVSPVMAEVLQEALIAADASEGIVVPTVLEALEAAGYDRSFEQLAATHEAAVDHPAVVGDWREIELDRRARTLRTPAGMRLDLGGVAKGWAADRAAARLDRSGPAMVDAAGDIAVRGPKRDGLPWAIAVDDPRNPDQRLALLKVMRGGVATSGWDYRRWKVNGNWHHHLIDPRTGEPADTDVLSATVVAGSVRQAEMAAKVVVVLGCARGLEWLNRHHGYAGLLVLETEEVLHSRGLRPYLWS